jgi:hypothetical protein
MRPSTNGASSWLAASSAHVPGQSLLDSSTNTSFFFFVGGGGPTAKLTLCNALHSLGQSIQVVAITIYFLLATAFYVFLAPFLWIGALESAAFALYSPLVSHFFLPSFFFFFLAHRALLSWSISFAVHYGLAALHALFGDQSGRPWSFEESALIQAR